MQYILSEDEYKSLLLKEKQVAKLPSEKELQEFCTMVADNMPFKGGWYDGKVWQCILTLADESENREWYCDDCPAQKLCPYPYKNWSK